MKLSVIKIGTVGSFFRYAAKLTGFLPPPFCSSNRRWYPGLSPDSVSFPAARSRTILRHAGSAQSRDCTSALRSRLLQKSERAGDRRVGTAPAARDIRFRDDETQAHASRSRILGRAIPVLAALERHSRHRQAGHRDSHSVGCKSRKTPSRLRRSEKSWMTSSPIATGPAGNSTQRGLRGSRQCRCCFSNPSDSIARSTRRASPMGMKSRS